LLAPARSLQFEVLESVPGHGSQRHFFHQQEQEAESWDQLLGRLLSQLGEEFVFQAQLIERYCPEKSWKKVLFSNRENQTLKPSLSRVFSRPSRVLKEPISLTFQPGLLLQSNQKVWRTLSWIGPERLSDEWWMDSPERKVDRDYYQVMTTSHEKLWVFFDRNQSPLQLFLQGYFD
jgi:nucleotidyltransferase/DNA polymerase involved in DNA repair